MKFVSTSLNSLCRRQDQEDAASFFIECDGDSTVPKWTPLRVGPYLVLKKLGSGSFGSVYICKHTETSKKYAGKLFDKDFVQNESNMKMVASEVAVLKETSHENTVSFVDLVFSQHGVLLVMDLVHGSDLRDFAPSGKGMVESFARVVFEQLLKAIQHIHKRRIIHRDIKIENVMVDKQGTLKLVDFGLAEKALEDHDGLTVTGYCGTPAYYSPELAQCELDDGGNDNEFAGDKIDIWAAGVLLYCVVSGKEPFLRESRYELLHEISQNNALWNVEFSCELKDLLQSILRTDPTERLSIEQILSHPWIKGEKFPSFTKETFTSKSQRVQVHIDIVFPRAVESCPKTSFAGRNGTHVAKRAVSMVDLVDWRRDAPRNEVDMSSISEWSSNADEKASTDFNYAETSGLCAQKPKKSYNEHNVGFRISFLRRLISFIPSLLRRKPRGRPLTEEDIAQVW